MVWHCLFTNRKCSAQSISIIAIYCYRWHILRVPSLYRRRRLNKREEELGIMKTIFCQRRTRRRRKYLQQVCVERGKSQARTEKSWDVVILVPDSLKIFTCFCILLEISPHHTPPYKHTHTHIRQKDTFFSCTTFHCPFSTHQAKNSHLEGRPRAWRVELCLSSDGADLSEQKSLNSGHKKSMGPLGPDFKLEALQASWLLNSCLWHPGRVTHTLHAFH